MAFLPKEPHLVPWYQTLTMFLHMVSVCSWEFSLQTFRSHWKSIGHSFIIKKIIPTQLPTCQISEALAFNRIMTRNLGMANQNAKQCPLTTLQSVKHLSFQNKCDMKWYDWYDIPINNYIILASITIIIIS